MSAQLIAVNGLIYIGFEVANKALPFILVPILTHYLSPADLGLVSEFTAILGVMAVFVGLSVHGAINVAYFKLDKSEVPSYVFNALLILVFSTLLVLLLIVIGSGWYAEYSRLPRRWIYLAVFAAAMQFISIINLTLWQVEKRPMAYGSYQLIQTSLNFGLSITLVVVAMMGWEGRLYGQVISTIVLALLSLVVLTLRGYLKIRLNIAYMKDALKFGIPLIPHALTSWIYVGFNILLITRVLGEEKAGIFTVTMQFAMVMAMITQATNRAIQPIFFEALPAIDAAGKAAIVKYTYVGFMVTAFVGFLLWSASMVAIDLFINPEFHSAKDYLVFLFLSATFDGFYYFVVKYVFYVNKTHLLAVATGIGAIVHVSTAWWLIGAFGLYGVAVAAVISSFSTFLLVWYLSSRIYPMPWLSFLKT